MNGRPCNRLLGTASEVASGTFRTACPRCGRVETINFADLRLASRAQEVVTSGRAGS
jgi:phage FluMu protein Com